MIHLSLKERSNALKGLQIKLRRIRLKFKQRPAQKENYPWDIECDFTNRNDCRYDALSTETV